MEIDLKRLGLAGKSQYIVGGVTDGQPEGKVAAVGGNLFPMLPGLFQNLPQPAGNCFRRVVPPMRRQGRNEGFADRVNQPVLFRRLTTKNL